MKVLAFDTATAACSAALWSDESECGGKILASRYRPMERGQSEALMSMIGEVMAEAELSFRDLDRLAVTVGPGAFTGVRIGLAAAKGLALAGQIPLVGVTTLETIAVAALREGDSVAEVTGEEAPEVHRPRPACLFVALAAGRSDLYVQFFAADSSPLGVSPLTPPDVMLPAEAPEVLCARPTEGPLMVAGNGAPIVRNILETASGPEPGGDVASIAYGAGPGLPDAVQVAAIAAYRDLRSPEARAEPLYIHPHYARLPEGAKFPRGGTR